MIMKTKMNCMKKQVVLLFASLLFGWVFAYSQPVDLGVGNDDDPDPTLPLPGKGSIVVPSVDLDGYELSFQSSHPTYTLYIVEDEVVVYSVVVSSTTTSVVLPSWLSGEYKLQLHPDGCNYYFYGYINL